MEHRIFPRKMFQTLMGMRDDKKIVLLLGSRQVGKTTLMKELSSELSKTNKSLFLDLDVLSNYERVSTFEGFVGTLKLNGYREGQKDFFYVFLDEFQKYPGMPKVMKNVHDNLGNVKIYASGSSSLAIKDSAQESLAGRKRICELYPLDFEEFLWFKQSEKASEQLSNSRSLSGEGLSGPLRDLEALLGEFLIFGGYPEVVLAGSKEEKIAALEGIFDLYVKKDLVDYLRMGRMLPMKRVMELLAVNNGQRTKYDDLAKSASSSFTEVRHFIEILAETYIVRELRPFYTNRNKEIVKMPKIYFIDPGVRNFFIRNFNDLSIRADAGFLFEGFVISELLKKGARSMRFWRDKNGNEVDLIAEKDTERIPVEIKFKQALKSEDFKGLNAFRAEYPATRDAFLVSLAAQKASNGASLILPYCLGKIGVP
jgi:predicted AAA+ superfamily ATPase